MSLKKHFSPKSISCSLWIVLLLATWKSPYIPMGGMWTEVELLQKPLMGSEQALYSSAAIANANPFISLGCRQFYVLDAPPLGGIAYGKAIRLPRRCSPAQFQPCQRRTQKTPKYRKSGQTPLQSNYIKRLHPFHSSWQLTIHI